ncbi:uncharacterized protein PHALS_15474 [Plasmopara halstedii]|uniref:Uncharacterized protein n=1 Tax=Plasmopara halstedii TaxID=4781 RepID=A0A0P1AIM7_PLAHL|nr:uncharacterized protein PHALS_15474 [Plasmopara halstedii]CEG40882.1 hypothetical protein PHALS_15474 [Plasmopara halstedii]|eukprot:XP_024577251.1 hypothetical protein PHALS_15474 [Plasmopara halstedii]
MCLSVGTSSRNRQHEMVLCIVSFHLKECLDVVQLFFACIFLFLEAEHHLFNSSSSVLFPTTGYW